MVQRHQVIGYEPFKKFMENFKADENPIIMLFTGTDLENGKSWCDDCRNAHPIIEEAIEKYADPNIHFIEVKVGDRETWKNLNCSFRKDPKLRLMVIPTILKWQSPQRLEGEQCEKMDLLEMFFTEDE